MEGPKGFRKNINYTEIKKKIINFELAKKKEKKKKNEAPEERGVQDNILGRIHVSTQVFQILMQGAPLSRPRKDPRLVLSKSSACV